jgi:hypothetical protein
MEKNYQSPEAVEIGKADSTILGEKIYELWDEVTMSFDQQPASAVDVDE